MEQAKADLARYSKQNEPQKFLAANLKLCDHYLAQVNAGQGLSPAADAAISHANQALEILAERASNTQLYANTLSNLARAHQLRSAGNRGDNLVKALECFKAAIKVSTCPPLLVAHCHTSISAIYGDDGFVVGTKQANKDLSVRHQLAACQIYSKTANPIEWANAHVALGKAYKSRTSGLEVANLKIAIKHWTSALCVYTKAASRDGWGSLQSLMADAYHMRVEILGPNASKRSALLEKCLEHCTHALEIFTKNHQNVVARATLERTIAIVYRRRTVGDRSNNLEQCIIHSAHAVDAIVNMGRIINQPEMIREMLAMVYINSAMAYAAREVGMKKENLEFEIKHYSKVLENSSPTFVPYAWVTAHVNIGIALLHEDKTGDTSENAKAAIKHLRLSLDINSPESSDWALAHVNLGLAHVYLTQGDKQSNLKTAMQHFAAVDQENRVKMRHPVLWTRAVACLVDIYRMAASGISHEDRLEKEIECYMRLLTVWTEESNPAYRTLTHRNLAMSYSERLKGERSKNLKKSLEYYAMSIAGVDGPMEETFPDGVPMISYASDSAGGYGMFHRPQSRPAASSGEVSAGGKEEEDEKDSLEKAVAALKESRWIATKETDTAAWATEQVKLADTYLKLFGRDCGKERGDNVEKAIGCYKAALEVFTAEIFSEKFADVQMSLCAAYLQRVEGKRRENLEDAMRCFNACKEVRGGETFPKEWVKQQGEQGAKSRMAAAAAAGN